MRTTIVEGGAALLTRQVIAIPLNAFGIAAATLCLSPVDFGVHAWITAAVYLLVIPIDLGVSPALVRRGEPPGAPLLRRIRCFQLLVGIIALATLLANQSFITSALGVDGGKSAHQIGAIISSCALIAVLQSWRSVEAARLQRELKFTTLARCEIAEVAAMNISLATAAYLLRSPWSFIIAVVVRWLVGLLCFSVIAYRRTPTLAEDSLNEKSGRAEFVALAKAGLPIQLLTLTPMLNALAIPVIVGQVYGLDQVGVMNWSLNITQYALVLLLPLPHFLFSIFSFEHRIGKETNSLRLQQAIDAGSIAIAVFILALNVALAWAIPRFLSADWSEALLSVSLFGLAVILWAPITILSSLLNAQGYSRDTLTVTLTSSAVVWVLGLLFASIGAIAVFPVAWLAAAIVSALLLSAVTHSKIEVGTSLSLPLYCTVLVGITLLGLDYWSPTSDRTLLASGALFGSAVILIVVGLLPFYTRLRGALSLVKMLRSAGKSL